MKSVMMGVEESIKGVEEMMYMSWSGWNGGLGIIEV